MVAGLKDLLRGLGASDPEVLYGGTVKKDNIEQFAALEVLDGVGATRASLDAAGFLAMIDRMASSG
jgi:triosephosphate isomerase